MIFVRDKGRTGNNILQYAHVYAWAREHGRRAVSMRFCYKYQYFKICHTPWHNFLTYLFAKYAAKIGLSTQKACPTSRCAFRREIQTKTCVCSRNATG